MRFTYSLFILLFSASVMIAQNPGETISYNSDKGIYEVKYWSVGDSTFYTIPLFPGDKLQPRINAVVSKQNGSYVYKYSIENSKASLRELYTFSIQVKPGVSEIKNPNREWRGNFVSWSKRVKWVQSNSISDTLGTMPGKSVEGTFTFQVGNLPGLTNAKVSSYWGLGNTKDEGPTGKLRAKIDSILKATKFLELKTIGPRNIPESIANTVLLDTLQSYLSFSCDTTWIENQGTCRSLEAKLDNTGRQLQRNTPTAANTLQAFLNELDALKEKQLSSEAYALLYYNGQFLLEKLIN